jgi:hypothetical protein
LKKEAGINKNNQFICFLKQKKLIEHEALYEERREERVSNNFCIIESERCSAF